MFKRYFICISFFLCAQYVQCDEVFHTTQRYQDFLIKNKIAEITRENLKPSILILKQITESNSWNGNDKFAAYLKAAVSYKIINDYYHVFYYLKKAEGTLKSCVHPEKLVPNFNFQMGLAHADMQHFDESLYYLSQIDDQSIKYIIKENHGLFYMQIGYLYLKKKQYNEAKIAFEKSNVNLKKYDDYNLPILCIKQMELYAALKDRKAFDSIMKIGLDYAAKYKELKYTSLIYEVARRTAQLEKDYAAYLKYDSFFDSIQGILKQDEFQKALLDQETNFTIKNQRKALAIQENKVKYSYYILITVIGFSLCFVVLFYRNRKKARLIQAKNVELNELNKMNKRIFSIISHDIKQPLIGFQLILEDLKQNKQISQETFEEVHQQIFATNKALENLIEWSYRELNFNFELKQSYDSHAVVDELIVLINHQFSNKKLNFINQVQPGYCLNIPKELLKIVMTNILSNAVKYSAVGSNIIVFSDKNSILVEDEGIGLPNGISLIQFNQKVAPRYGLNGEMGYGLGLYICNELLKKVDYQIIGRKNELKGSTFSIEKLNV